MHARFYAPDAHRTGQIVTLPADEAAHATRVMRLKPGDQVRVFDGAGHEFLAVIDRATKTNVDVRLEEPHPAAPERRIRVALAQAVLKGDKMDDVVRDAVMMGVTSIIPLLATRSEVSAATLQRRRSRERWERIAIVSAKQCGRAVVPAIEEPCDLDALVARGVSDGQATTLMFVEPAAAGGARSEFTAAPLDSATLIIGPEGGWTSEEIDKTASAVSHLTLAGPTLRADAMALVALSMLFTRWDAF